MRVDSCLCNLKAKGVLLSGKCGKCAAVDGEVFFGICPGLLGGLGWWMHA